MSTFLTGMDIGMGLGAGFWGMVIDLAGMKVMFFACAGVSLGAYVLYQVLHVEKKAA